MKQSAFAVFYAPEAAPVQGSTPESLAASLTGAEAADPVRRRNSQVLLELWRTPRTMQDMAELAGLPLASVCSLKASLGARIVWDSYEHVPGGPGRKATKRSKWRRRDL